MRRQPRHVAEVIELIQDYLGGKLRIEEGVVQSNMKTLVAGLASVHITAVA